ncbi:radical SAM protein [bacterium]|nr:radical SAM protein [bacterium]
MNKKGIQRTQPLLSHIIDLISQLLNHVEFLQDGEVVHPNQIRLKHPEVWLQPVSSDLISNINSLTTGCNCSCDFCYIKGNPPEIALDSNSYPSLNEVNCRIQLYKQGLEIFQYIREYGEPFCNPNAVTILQNVRKASPNEVLCLSTNGSKLTETIINQLASLKPIYIFLSLNSADPNIRRNIMHDSNPLVAIQAPNLLKNYGITWFGGIVAWPSIPLTDIEKTIRFMDDNGAQVIRIGLPGMTKLHPPVDGVNILIHKWKEYWNKVVDLVRKIRKEIATPIYWQPFAYEGSDIIPEVVGVVKNSPAYHAGIQPGDVIINIGGVDVSSRNVCIKLLTLSPQKQEITVNQDGRIMKVVLSDIMSREIDLSPYKPVGYLPQDNQGIIRKFGLCLHDDLDLPAFTEIKRIIKERNSQKPAVVSSWLKYPYVRTLLDKNGLTAVSIEIVKSVCFGGNIQITDLLNVRDIIEHFRGKVEYYDLILVPSSLLVNGMDLFGQSLWDISLELGIDVALFPCRRIMT